MKAMILAAGYGTRLKPLTDHKPKALVEINGIAMLELLIQKFIRAGIRDIIINVHHFADMIADFIRSNQYFGINIHISFEEHILGTGGGIKKAAYFFDDDQPFLVHNVDIISDIDFHEFHQYHINKKNFVTVAVKKRESKRYFIVNQESLICGHVDRQNHIERVVQQPAGQTELLAFSGIHLISPRIFPFMTDDGFFSVIDVYLKLIEQSYPVGAFQMDRCYWRDIGKLDNLRQVQRDIENGLIDVMA